MSTDVEQSLRIAELEREVRGLRSQVAELHSELVRQERHQSEAVPRVLQQLMNMTHEILPGEVRIEDSTDPEYPDTPSIVFRVSPNAKPGNIDAVIDKEIEWHRAARKILPSATCHFSLAIDT